MVRELPNLTEIRLGGTTVEAADLQNLRTLKIDRLHFSQSRLAEGAVAAFVDACPNVTQLGLSGSDIADSEMALIGTLKQLEWLWLHDTQISDAGLEKLDALKNLKRVEASVATISNLADQRFRQQHPGAVLSRN